MSHKVPKLLARLHRHYRVDSGRGFSLKRFDPDDHRGLDLKDLSDELLAESVKVLSDLQERLYAQDRWSVLLVFQALDAAGKDGTIKHVMSGLNPQGCEVHAFKAPSSEELDHDFLWRTTVKLPRRGHIGIFNRSYYEEMLIARVHPEILASQQLPDTLVTKRIWKERFEDVCAFERYLGRQGVVIRKFFLHLSKDEQRRRFLARLDEPEKNWKFSLGDVHEREHFDDYQRAYEDAIKHTASRRCAVVRGARGPQVVLAAGGRLGGDRRHRVDRSPLPRGQRRSPAAAAGGARRARGPAGAGPCDTGRREQEATAMSGDGLIDAGRGRRRCSWCGDRSPVCPLPRRRVGAAELRRPSRLFEKICLEGFQAGFSWLTILRKRERFRQVFDGFDPARVARYGARDVARLLKDPGIVRHRGKIASTINNARRMLELGEEFGSLAAYAWRWEPAAADRPTTFTWSVLKAMPTTPVSVALSKDLRQRGWTFVGPTTIYAFMQAMGLVNDHLEGCYVRPQVEQARRRARRPAAVRAITSARA